jgi:hypothetical protein
MRVGARQDLALSQALCFFSLSLSVYKLDRSFCMIPSNLKEGVENRQILKKPLKKSEYTSSEPICVESTL